MIKNIIATKQGGSMKLTTQSLIRIAIAIALIAIGGQIKIPSPLSGYFTLQLPMVIVTGIILGKKDGPISVLVYLMGGLLGIPWFATGGGIGYILRPTFGFLLSFVLASYLTAYGSQKNQMLSSLIFSTIATLSVWVIGMIYYTGINIMYLGKTGSYLGAIASIISLDLIFDLSLTYFSVIVGLRVKKHLGGSYDLVSV